MSGVKRARQGWRRLAAGTALVILTLTVAFTRTVPPVDASQPTAQRGLAGLLVTFEFDQTTATKDQITILFSNAAVDLRHPPKPVFGDDIVEEFSFSGRDFPKDKVSFSRRVRDRSFLDCRYIRVVNHGMSPWAPTNISLIVDGQRVLDKVSMYPRKGRSARGGLDRWNPDQWNPVFWETELYRYRAKGY